MYHWDDPNQQWFLHGYDAGQAWTIFDYVNWYATDSAAAATTMSTAEKTYGGAIGVNLAQEPLLHAFDVAEAQGKMTGVITSVQWSHATPAGFVAHNISRNNYAEIAQEMVYDAATDVIMGCGNPWFNPSGEPVSTPNDFKYVGGQATWDELVAGTAGGDANGDGVDDPWLLIQDRVEFQALMTGDTPERVLGVAQVYKTLQQGRDGDGMADPYVVPLTETVPTLEEMTRAALNILDEDPDGFCLMVEAGAVDWASHANQPGRVIEEEIDFNMAVEAAIEWVEENSNWGETLLIVTGDHETGYLTSPGSDASVPLVNNGPGSLPGMEFNSGSHTNSLIPLYVKGRGGRLLRHWADGYDPVRGLYIDNTDLGELIFRAIEP
jgi:alkaline phosphatase